LHFQRLQRTVALWDADHTGCVPDHVMYNCIEKEEFYSTYNHLHIGSGVCVCVFGNSIDETLQQSLLKTKAIKLGEAHHRI